MGETLMIALAIQFGFIVIMVVAAAVVIVIAVVLEPDSAEATEDTLRKSNLALTCTMCGSDRLETRRNSGFERFLRFFTRTVKYRCLMCKHSFRTLDRRQFPREDGDPLSSERVRKAH